MGANGTNGTNGTNGSTGPVGPAGANGPTGSSGASQLGIANTWTAQQTNTKGLIVYPSISSTGYTGYIGYTGNYIPSNAIVLPEYDMLTPSLTTQFGYSSIQSTTWGYSSGNSGRNQNSSLLKFTPKPIGSIWLVCATASATTGNVTGYNLSIQKGSWAQITSTGMICGDIYSHSPNTSMSSGDCGYFNKSCMTIYQVADISELVLGMSFLTPYANGTLNIKMCCTRIA
jgi:hypothetical protein